MKVYLVGGAVRDGLLGRAVTDRDYVVLGETPDRMLAAGFRPVGGDFPVFLHPTTHEEYALARTERKAGRGYAGFVFCADEGVTLAEDLARRDVTINAMAQDLSTGEIIDYYGGKADVLAGVLRHVSAAFVEDPVRVLRVARFAARFGFAVADETKVLMRHMGEAGELHYLVAERIWLELSRALTEAQPALFFEVLQRVGADAWIFGQRDGLTQPYATWMIEALPRLRLAADAPMLSSLSARFALLTQDFDAAKLAAFARDYRVPKQVTQDAMAWQRWLIHWADAASGSAAKVLALFQALDIYRKPQQFDQCVAWSQALAARSARVCVLPDAHALAQIEAQRQAVLAVPVANIVAQCKAQDRNNEVPQWIEQERLAAIAMLAP